MATTLESTHAFTFKLAIKPPVPVGTTPAGNRTWIEVTGGTVTGSGVQATVLPGGGDYVITGTDGYAKLEVRIHAKTQEGDVLYIHYPGYLELNEAAGKVLTGAQDAKSIDYHEIKYMITPFIETGSEKLAWVNRSTFVGKGSVELSAEGAFVVYQVFKLS